MNILKRRCVVCFKWVDFVACEPVSLSSMKIFKTYAQNIDRQKQKKRKGQKQTNEQKYQQQQKYESKKKVTMGI